MMASKIMGREVSFKAAQCGRLHLSLNTSSFREHSVNRRANRLVTTAAFGDGKAYNKYRSRRDIENDYYRDWERTTLVAEEETNRPMTVFTFLAFLPSWMKFYALPGPLRFLCYLIWRQISAVGHSIHKQLVLQGAKLDTVLARRSGLGAAAIPRSIILARYHHRVSAIENIKFRLALLSGRRYTPKLAAVDC